MIPSIKLSWPYRVSGSPHRSAGGDLVDGLLGHGDVPDLHGAVLAGRRQHVLLLRVPVQPVDLGQMTGDVLDGAGAFL